MSSLSYLSSRGGAPPVTLSEAIRQGLAPDGGLYVPNRLPSVDVASLAGLSSLPDVARFALGGFFEGDRLQPQLPQIADAALDMDAPTTAVRGCENRLFALELSHGPTAAFKRRGGRVPSAAVGANRDPLSERTREPAPGTAADLLGRECDFAADRRHLR
jgi:threonine synthase